MKFFKTMWCAMIVFVAYAKLGYYAPWQVTKAIRAYFKEMRELGGSVFVGYWHKVPVGTIMCSKDNGALPIDAVFPKEMKFLRTLYHGRIVYAGKFAVIPFLQGRTIGRYLMSAVADWCHTEGRSIVVMVVNPMHVGLYRRLGAEVLAKSDVMTGIEKAPAVLMMLDLEYAKTKRARSDYHNKNKETVTVL